MSNPTNTDLKKSCYLHNSRTTEKTSNKYIGMKEKKMLTKWYFVQKNRYKSLFSRNSTSIPANLNGFTMYSTSFRDNLTTQLQSKQS